MRRVRKIAIGFCFFVVFSAFGFGVGPLLTGFFSELLGFESFPLSWIIWGIFSLIGLVQFIQVSTEEV